MFHAGFAGGQLKPASVGPGLTTDETGTRNPAPSPHSMSDQTLPYWRISGFYLFYFAILGATVPYWNVYLQEVGFTALQIGWITAITLAVRVVAPNLWGWFADRLGRRMVVVRLGMVLALLFFLLVGLRTDFLWIAVTMTLFSFFWNACLAQFEANTLNHLGSGNNRYGLLRLWGSVGFIAVVAGGGLLLDHFGISLLLPMISLLLLGGVFASMVVPDHAGKKIHDQPAAFTDLIRQPRVVWFLLACLLMQMSHGPFYTFFSIHLESIGYPRSVVGYLWALGVVAEVGVFILLARVMPRLGVDRVLIGSLFLAVVRWVLNGLFVDVLWVVIVAQLLHAATFGAFHVAAIARVHQLFSGRYQGRGQALFSSAGFGLGGALGGLYSGYAWEGVGPANTYLLASSVAGVGLLVLLVPLMCKGGEPADR